VSLKTVHITNAYHPTSGGIRTFYNALLNAANDCRRRVRLIVPGPRDAVEQVGRFGRIYFVEARQAPVFDTRYRLILPGAYLLPRQSRIIRILEEERADLVEVCDKYALPYLAAILRKNWLPRVPRPVLVGLSCERMDDNIAAYCHAGSAARRFARWYIRNIYGPPFDFHIANSEYTAEELQSSLSDRPPDFIHVLPMGVDADRFSREHRDLDLRRRLLERAGGTVNSALLFYAGRLSPEKNAGLLLDALERLVVLKRSGWASERDYRLVLAGGGPWMDTLAAAAEARAPGRVLMLGPLEMCELARYYASADVFVHPNPREPFGIAPLEAMASGVPVVLPDAGGVLTYANRENAWLAAPDANSFALAIQEALERPEPARLDAARETALTFRWDRITRCCFALYDRLHGSFRARQSKAVGAAQHASTRLQRDAAAGCQATGLLSGVHGSNPVACSRSRT
jgi:alpha-1,6-mannosyltransferase